MELRIALDLSSLSAHYPSYKTGKVNSQGRSKMRAERFSIKVQGSPTSFAFSLFPLLLQFCSLNKLLTSVFQPSILLLMINCVIRLMSKWLLKFMNLRQVISTVACCLFVSCICKTPKMVNSWIKIRRKDGTIVNSHKHEFHSFHSHFLIVYLQQSIKFQWL